MIVRVPATRIEDWDSFHDVFAELFGFPEFYGRNMNAWIDCMSDLDLPGTGMTSVHLAPGEVLALHLEEASAFASRCPERVALATRARQPAGTGRSIDDRVAHGLRRGLGN